jgi:hypothetical protein
MRLGADVRVHRERNDTMPASFADLFANDCGIDSIPADVVIWSTTQNEALIVTDYSGQPHVDGKFD